MKKLERWLRYSVLDETCHKRSPRRKKSTKGPARNWKYRQWIRSLPCATCGALKSEAAHTGSDGGMRQKASDYSCIPLCWECHSMYHQIGKACFEERNLLDCQQLVRRLNDLWFRFSQEVK